MVVTRQDRLGRDTIDMLQTRAVLAAMGVALIGIVEPIDNDLMFTIKAALSQEERRKTAERSQEGVTRAVHEGRWTGGVKPYGYRVVGTRPNCRLEIDDETIAWGTWTTADVVRHIFRWVVEDHWSCPRIADELNALGVPTAYGLDGPYGRMKGRRPIWRPGRILSLIRLQAFKGVATYGKRGVKNGSRAEVLTTEIPALIPPEVWDAAQDIIDGKRLKPIQGDRRLYILRSKIRSTACDVNYCGTNGTEGKYWYRCNGKSRYKGEQLGKCNCKSAPGPWLEDAIWNDIERFLEDPGDLVAELQREVINNDPRSSDRERQLEERHALEVRLDALNQKTIALGRSLVDGRLSHETYDALKAEIDSDLLKVRQRLNVLEDLPEPPAPVAIDVLERIRERLHAGLTREEQFDIIGHLVRGIVATNVPGPSGRDILHLKVEYAFDANSVVSDHTRTRVGHDPAITRELVWR